MDETYEVIIGELAIQQIDDIAIYIARNSSGAGTASEMAAAGTSAVILETHGAAATGCDWCLNMPCTLASCDAGGGLRVWG